MADVENVPPAELDASDVVLSQSVALERTDTVAQGVAERDALDDRKEDAVPMSDADACGVAEEELQLEEDGVPLSDGARVCEVSGDVDGEDARDTDGEDVRLAVSEADPVFDARGDAVAGTDVVCMAVPHGDVLERSVGVMLADTQGVAVAIPERVATVAVGEVEDSSDALATSVFEGVSEFSTVDDAQELGVTEEEIAAEAEPVLQVESLGEDDKDEGAVNEGAPLNERESVGEEQDENDTSGDGVACSERDGEEMVEADCD